MDAAEQVIRGAYQLGALSPSEPARQLYLDRGWIQWLGPTVGAHAGRADPDPRRRRPVFVLPVAVNLDPTADLVCDWRSGDVW